MAIGGFANERNKNKNSNTSCPPSVSLQNFHLPSHGYPEIHRIPKILSPFLIKSSPQINSLSFFLSSFPFFSSSGGGKMAHVRNQQQSLACEREPGRARSREKEGARLGAGRKGLGKSAAKTRSRKGWSLGQDLNI